jgi:hypothetical protein
MDGRQEASRWTTVRSGSQNFSEILSWFEPRLDGVALSSERSHFSCKQFPYQGFALSDQGNSRTDSWSDARNFHISNSRVRTIECCRPDVWILNAQLALWMRASGRESTSSGRLQRSSHICVLERNPVGGRTLSVVQTCCINIQTDASWNKSKLLDIKEGPGWKFSSSGRMMLWIVGCPDGISRRPDGCKGSDLSYL